MKVELGAPVVLRDDQPDIWHLPQPAKKTLEHVQITVDDGLEHLASSWPTLCLHEPGSLFVYGGFIRRRQLCPGCAFVNRQAPHVMPPGEAQAATEYETLARELNANLEPLVA